MTKIEVATKLTGTTFSVVLTQGAQHIPEGIEASLYASDGNNQSGFIGVRTGGVITFIRNVEGYSLPVFSDVDDAISIVCSVPAGIFNQQFQGNYGSGVVGQSGGNGWNTGKDDAAIIGAERPRDYVFDFRSENIYPTLYSEPGNHPDTDTQFGLTDVSMTFFLHYAEVLHRAGAKKVTAICCCVGGTSFNSGYWRRGGVGYNYALAKHIAFLDESPLNFLGDITVHLGPQDSQDNVTAQDYAVDMFNFPAHFKEDIQAGTIRNVDVSKVPIIWVGMNSFFGAQGTGEDIEATMANARNIHPFAGYAPMHDLPLNGGVAFPQSVHSGPVAHRILGIQRMYEARKQALRNSYGLPSEGPDVLGPVITLIGSDNVEVQLDGTYNELGATAFDNVDGNVTSSIQISGDAVDETTEGSYIVRYNAQDSIGNVATEVIRTVVVTANADTTAPVITLTGGAVNHTLGTPYIEPGYSAFDNVDGDLTGSVNVVGDDFDVNTADTYIVTYDLTDAAGNIAIQRTRAVTVSPAAYSGPTAEILLVNGVGLNEEEVNSVTAVESWDDQAGGDNALYNLINFAALRGPLTSGGILFDGSTFYALTAPIEPALNNSNGVTITMEIRPDAIGSVAATERLFYDATGETFLSTFGEFSLQGNAGTFPALTVNERVTLVATLDLAAATPYMRVDVNGQEVFYTESVSDQNPQASDVALGYFLGDPHFEGLLYNLAVIPQGMTLAEGTAFIDEFFA